MRKAEVPKMDDGYGRHPSRAEVPRFLPGPCTCFSPALYQLPWLGLGQHTASEQGKRASFLPLGASPHPCLNNGAVVPSLPLPLYPSQAPLGSVFQSAPLPHQTPATSPQQDLFLQCPPFPLLHLGGVSSLPLSEDYIFCFTTGYHGAPLAGTALAS